MAKKTGARKLSDLKGNKANPRVITSARKAKLLKDLARMGDISGIVYNARSKQVVGGHQRTEVFNADGADIEYTRLYDKPTAQGTIAEGFITWRGGRYAYREVDWTPAMEREANIVANTHAGDWNYQFLAANYESTELSGFGLTMNFVPPVPIPDPAPVKDRMEDGGGNEGPDGEPGDGGEEEDDDDGPAQKEAPNAEGPSGEMLFPVNATLTKAMHLHWSKVKEVLGKRRDSEAFVELVMLLKDGGIDKLL